MAEILRLFVSATQDLEAERAIIGQTLADLPVQIAAEIRRTPATGLSYESIFERMANVDRVYFLMGQDITAPAGLEWQLAAQLERAIYPLRRAGSQTVAAREFLGWSFAEWTVYRSPAHLAQLVGLDLIERLLHPLNRYGLNTVELEALTLRRAEIRRGAIQARGEAGGAQGGGVLLDPAQRDAYEGRVGD
jgi:hypothetical protein